MTDIVERLRNRREMINRGHGNVIDVPDEDCIEAADVIERLRAKNRELASTIATRLLDKDTKELRDEIERLRAIADTTVIMTEQAIKRLQDEAVLWKDRWQAEHQAGIANEQHYDEMLRNPK